MVAKGRRAKYSPSAAKRPGPRDVYIGRRIQLARSSRGVSQVRLAQALKISFQQVQKYEAGSNRVGAARVYEISRYLDVPLEFFFDGLENISPEIPPAAAQEPGRDFLHLLDKLVDTSARKRVLKFLRLTDLYEPVRKD